MTVCLPACRMPPGTALLYGVTGSGKTVAYLRLIDDCLAAGRGAIVLCRRSP